MTYLTHSTIVTEIDAHDDNAHLTARGCTIRHIETWHGHTDISRIVWDAPEITERDIPY